MKRPSSSLVCFGIIYAADIGLGNEKDWTAVGKHLNSLLTDTRMHNDTPLLLAIPLLWSRDDRERITQVCFEYLNVPGLYLASQVLSNLLTFYRLIF